MRLPVPLTDDRLHVDDGEDIRGSASAGPTIVPIVVQPEHNPLADFDPEPASSPVERVEEGAPVAIAGPERLEHHSGAIAVQRLERAEAKEPANQADSRVDAPAMEVRPTGSPAAGIVRSPRHAILTGLAIAAVVLLAIVAIYLRRQPASRSSEIGLEAAPPDARAADAADIRQPGSDASPGSSMQPADPPVKASERPVLSEKVARGTAFAIQAGTTGSGKTGASRPETGDRSTAGAAGNTASGSFSVASSLELRILENGRLLGLSTGAPVAVAAGLHRFDLVNEETELRIPLTVQIASGKATRLSVPRPTGTLSLDASPWAEVFLDGRSLGTTPIANVTVPLGRHDIAWRHPQLGSKRSTVVVGAQTPARVTMELSP